MAKTTDIGGDCFFENLRSDIQRRMVESCEPVIQKALKDIEFRMRKELGRVVLGMIDSNYSVVQNRDKIEITIFNKDEK